MKLISLFVIFQKYLFVKQQSSMNKELSNTLRGYDWR